MAEQVIYSAPGVSVSTARVHLSGTTYALRNVTSVRMHAKPADYSGGALVLIIGIIIGLCSLRAEAGSVISVLAVALVLIITGICVLIAQKPIYGVIFLTSAGEARALSTPDRRQVEAIVEAINEAIVRQANAPSFPSLPSHPQTGSQTSRSRYYYNSAQGAVGPVTEAQLQMLVDRGDVTGETLVRAETSQDWSRLEELVG